MRPVASSGVTRLTRRRMRLGAHAVPAGTIVMVPFDAVHHFRGNWDDPDAFDPVRPPFSPSALIDHNTQCSPPQHQHSPHPTSICGWGHLTPFHPVRPSPLPSLALGIQAPVTAHAGVGSPTSWCISSSVMGTANNACPEQERWAQPGVELASPEARKAAAEGVPPPGSAKRFLPFSTGSRQCVPSTSTPIVCCHHPELKRVQPSLDVQAGLP